MMKSTKDMIKSVVFGHAVGDALGVPVEFSFRDELKEDPVTDMRGYGCYSMPAGSWSDDTSMSIAALDSLADGRLDFESIMSNFCDWYRSGKYTPTGKMFDVGGTCSRAIENYFLRSLPANECGISQMSSNGNGSLMRIYPFVLFCILNKLSDGECDDVIAKASSLTHAHKISVLACKIYARVLTALTDLQSKESVIQALNETKIRYSDDPYLGIFERLFDSKFKALPESAIKSSGYTVDTLEAALWCLLTTDSYKECVLKAVNLGEDTDTVAAVAGSLAGAMYGYSEIPKEWLDTLIKKEYISEMCERMARNSA